VRSQAANGWFFEWGAPIGGAFLVQYASARLRPHGQAASQV